MAIVSGQTVRSLVNSDAPGFVQALIAVAGLLACVLQFFLGKNIGGYYKERISGGQALGQKNTVLAILTPELQKKLSDLSQASEMTRQEMLELCINSAYLKLPKNIRSI